jgi:hypothetical protein
MPNLFFSKEVGHLPNNHIQIKQSIIIETRKSEFSKEKNTLKFIGIKIPRVAFPSTDTSVSIVALTYSFNRISHREML